jgi:hypothetical protein
MTIKKYAGDKVVGLSTDIKPNNVPYGGTFYEVDTGKIYTKDSGNTWTYMSNTQFSNISVGGTANIVSELIVGGSVTATDFNSVSDMTLKENIQPIHNAQDILSQINPVSFQWKDTDDNKLSYGVVAQEIEKVLPEIVNTNGSGVKSVAYIQLIALLIDAVKTLNKEVQELKSLPSNPQEVENGIEVSLHKNTKKSKANRKTIR